MPTNAISIIGLGWLGWPLAKQLVAEGYQVTGTVTTVAKQQRLAVEEPAVSILCWQAEEQLPPSLCAPVMVITLPPGKLDDYAVALQTLITRAREGGVCHLIYISSTSVYGEKGHCDESSPLMPETAQAVSLVQVEQFVQQAGFPFCTILRPSGLFGPGRYPGRFLSGKTLAGGGRVVNLVHQTDVIGVISVLLQQPCNDIFNLAAPDHPTRAQFYGQACQHAGLPLPQFSDMDDDGKLIDGGRVESVLGYHYQVRDLMAWLQSATAGE